MDERTTVAHRVLEFNEELADTVLELPPGFKVINPFSGPQRGHVRKVTGAFYQRYYNDHKPRRLVMGSSPARRGTAVTGVPFEDAEFLESETGTGIDGYVISRSSSGFIHDVITRYGGRDRFYGDFVMSFVCPLGLVTTNSKGNEVNCNYYENKKLLESLRSFITDTMKRQLAFGADASVCYCIGSGENFKFLSRLTRTNVSFKRSCPWNTRVSLRSTTRGERMNSSQNTLKPCADESISLAASSKLRSVTLTAPGGHGEAAS